MVREELAVYAGTKGLGEVGMTGTGAARQHTRGCQCRALTQPPLCAIHRAMQ